MSLFLRIIEARFRKKIVEAAQVGRGVKAPTALEATATIKKWFVETPGYEESQWEDDKIMLSWMGQNHASLEQKVVEYTKQCVVQEVVQVMTAGGDTARIGTIGIVEGVSQAYEKMTDEEKSAFKAMMQKVFSG